jgi:ubiquinone/menaquinone biosynthesis C-methylase UbiE
MLTALDVQQEMLDILARRAAKYGVTNIAPIRADAQSLPFEDQSFDAIYLLTVLGEIPDRAAALREFRRVLKVNGRLVVGEFCIDPDYVSRAGLRREAEAAGFRLERTVGIELAYLARFRPA